MSDEDVVCRWIDGLINKAQAEGMLGRGIVTVVQMPDGRRFRITVEPAKHADDLHREAMDRILGQIEGGNG